MQVETIPGSDCAIIVDSTREIPSSEANVDTNTTILTPQESSSTIATQSTDTAKADAVKIVRDDTVEVDSAEADYDMMDADTVISDPCVSGDPSPILEAGFTRRRLPSTPGESCHGHQSPGEVDSTADMATAKDGLLRPWEIHSHRQQQEAIDAQILGNRHYDGLFRDVRDGFYRVFGGNRKYSIDGVPEGVGGMKWRA